MTSLESLLGEFAAGDRIFLSGSSGEPREFVEAIGAAAPALPELEFTHSFLPGINTLPIAARENKLTEVALFPRRHSAENDAVKLKSGSYYATSQFLAEQAYDWVVVQASPPDQDGQCSLGPSAEFVPAVLNRANRVIGILNHNVPVTKGAPRICRRRFSALAESSSPLVTYSPGRADDVSRAIARHLSGLIDDRSVLQVGLGRVPASLLEQLSGAKELSIHTGLLTEGVRNLADCGALSDAAAHVCCTALGSEALYQWLGKRSDLKIQPVSMSHEPGRLASIKRFVAINSALEVDLLGRANLEFVGDKAVSSRGGAPDFCRGARSGVGGRSVIALPSTVVTSGELRSRVVAPFPRRRHATLSTDDIDYVVTEYGVAHLSQNSAKARAQALISVAAPQFRESLERHLYEFTAGR